MGHDGHVDGDGAAAAAMMMMMIAAFVLKLRLPVGRDCGVDFVAEDSEARFYG